MEYESNDDRNKTVSVEEYFSKVSPFSTRGKFN